MKVRAGGRSGEEIRGSQDGEQDKDRKSQKAHHEAHELRLETLSDVHLAIGALGRGADGTGDRDGHGIREKKVTIEAHTLSMRQRLDRRQVASRSKKCLSKQLF